MNMKLVLPPDYIAQASKLTKKAKKRIYLIAMVIADHPATHELMIELEHAAQRGVTVTVTADIFTYGEVSGGFLPLKYYSPGVKAVNHMVKRLKAAGVTFLWLGRGHMTLLNGRTHSKWCVIDDECFVFGGVNIYQAGVAENADYMFRVNNNRLADRLVYEQERIAKAERASTNYPSVSYELDKNSVLIDGGIIAHSVIYRRAVELAKEAKSIIFVSQYCPTGKLARIFKGKQVELYFNRPEQANSLNKVLIRISMLTSGFITNYKNDAYLHAKFIIFTMTDGTRIAITGSHNFAFTGVLLGTREIALETSDPNIIDQLQSFYEQYVKT
ncbi:MAG: phosphatidylserine/phosphatidylglycerophosphate/cardiolipin synthase family protein [Candidatus Microsaccharimonas sossegonensis]|uniref:phospholipase D n=1 Tax=Candidatus Microsaccharimonas sossegonensis TaxID=2506948 RepID=A0A4Q0AII8_9BACT|nr:MAG: phosphatidylserine/phosphatidylglycerophosphate/cardiolipin synthase family protein [Candidatus Microsaccharimonas sossegonensis]